MTDVRLTATNPDDSSVVPVACNAKGELLLAEDSASGDHVKLDDGGTKQVIESAGLGISDGTDENITLNASGSATFAGDVNLFDGTAYYAGLQKTTTNSVTHGQIYANYGAASATFFSVDYEGGIRVGDNIGSNNITAQINLDGSATFAGGNISLYPTGAADFMCTNPVSSNQYWLRAYNSNSLKLAQFNTDGSATFTGDVVIGSRNAQWMIVESGGIAHLVEQTFRTSGYPELRNIPQELTMVEQQLQKVMERLRMVPEAGWEVWDGDNS